MLVFFNTNEPSFKVPICNRIHSILRCHHRFNVISYSESAVSVDIRNHNFLYELQSFFYLFRLLIWFISHDLLYNILNFIELWLPRLYHLIFFNKAPIISVHMVHSHQLLILLVPIQYIEEVSLHKFKGCLHFFRLIINHILHLRQSFVFLYVVLFDHFHHFVHLNFFLGDVVSQLAVV